MTQRYCEFLRKVTKLQWQKSLFDRKIYLALLSNTMTLQDYTSFIQQQQKEAISSLLKSA